MFDNDNILNLDIGQGRGQLLSKPSGPAFIVHWATCSPLGLSLPAFNKGKKKCFIAYTYICSWLFNWIKLKAHVPTSFSASYSNITWAVNLTEVKYQIWICIFNSVFILQVGVGVPNLHEYTAAGQRDEMFSWDIMEPSPLRSCTSRVRPWSRYSCGWASLALFKSGFS